MSGSMCHDRDWPETPDAGSCCAGSAINGPTRCTCWTPQWAPQHQVQAAAQLDAPTRVCEQMCADCAYRPGSPERGGDPAAAANADDLDRIVAVDGQVFFCHQGMRKPVTWHHPSGMSIPGKPMDYQPVKVGLRWYQSDGQPAMICAGWAARRAKHLRDLGAPDTNPIPEALR